MRPAQSRKRIALSNAADVSRALPLYVLGSFRNDGTKSDRRVRITLKLMRGEAMVSSITKEDLAPDQVPAMLRNATASFLAKSKIASQPTADPRIEAAQLADRAHLMLSCGSWTEAMDLAEGSLLLNSHQPGMHRDVLATLWLSPTAPASPLRRFPWDKVDQLLAGCSHPSWPGTSRTLSRRDNHRLSTG